MEDRIAQTETVALAWCAVIPALAVEFWFTQSTWNVEGSGGADDEGSGCESHGILGHNVRDELQRRETA